MTCAGCLPVTLKDSADNQLWDVHKIFAQLERKMHKQLYSKNTRAQNMDQHQQKFNTRRKQFKVTNSVESQLLAELQNIFYQEGGKKKKKKRLYCLSNEPQQKNR